MSSLTARTAGAVAGIVLLGLVVVFAVGLPRWQDDDDGTAPSDSESAAATASGTLDLPDTLPGDFVAIDSDNLPDTLAQQLSDPDAIISGIKDSADNVTKLFGADATVRIYATADGQRLINVTALNKEPSLFVPDGPPAAASAQGQTSYDLRKVGDAVCAEYFQAPTDAQGQPTAGAPTMVRAHCQFGSDGRTIDVDSQGVGLKRLETINEALADI